jgi:hypothetical protein
MILVRSTTWAFRLFGVFVLCTCIATAQEPLPQKPSKVFNDAEALKEARGIPADDLPRAKQLFAIIAKYYADVLANPAVYRAPLELKLGAGGPRVPTVDRNNQTGILLELDQFILKPAPGSKINAEKADYIRELGVAFDAALKPLIENNQERIVRINAARVLADMCRSGATAYWPTVTGLLTSANIPPEVKYYALHAAANLLAAYDVSDYGSRKHSNGPKEVAALVQAITDCILPPEDGVSIFYPGLKLADITIDQAYVIEFIRRQAVKALAQVRFVTLPGIDGKKRLYPAYTLARVCVADPVLVPPPSPAECGEAVIGMCNMAPSEKGNPVKGYNHDTAVEAIVAGLKTFASPRADPADRSLPWHQYSIRLTDALKNWRPLFDPIFDATQPTSFNPTEIPASVNDLIYRTQTMILIPIEKVDFTKQAEFGGKVDVEGLKLYLDQVRGNPKRKPLLFETNPDTVIYKPEKK